MQNLCRNSFRESKGADVPGAVDSQDGLGHQSVAFSFSTSAVRVSICSISAATSRLQDLLTAIEAV